MGEPAARVQAKEGALRQIQTRLSQAVERVCPDWLRSQRDDIVQAAMLRVLPHLQDGGANDPRMSSPYLWRVAYSATVDEIRRLRARNEVELVDRPTTALGPDDDVARRQLADGIRDCLGRLVEPRRVAVTLFLQGHGVPDSSRLLGWDNKRVQNLVYRGLADLRRCLSSKGFEP